MRKPNYSDGRFFVSPILGCRGACSYCYLCLHDYEKPRINELTIDEILHAALNCSDFLFGRNGTIVSVGAWGDIFPIGYPELIEHSVKVITSILSWGNPVQIMSKYALPNRYVTQIADSIQYEGQLLYSTTITSLDNWRNIEPCTSSPIERLETCKHFHNRGVPTNVLLKPFFREITGTEIESIADQLREYQIDYCTVGILYWDENIIRKIHKNPFLSEKLHFSEEAHSHYLDCDGYQEMCSSKVSSLQPYVDFLRSKGIAAFLKSSCVNSNVLKTDNPSKYFSTNNVFCVNCGNCSSIADEN